MEQQMNSTPGAPAVIADRLAVVYDRSGRILHHHRVTTLAGGRVRTDEQVAEAALAHAKDSRGDDLAPGVAVILIAPSEFTAGHTHRVDVGARRLISTPIQLPPLRPR